MKDKQFDVIIVGELNVDLIMNNIEGTPVLGKEVFSRDMILTLGSSSAIFANNLSILGSNVTFLGRIGKDNFADLVCKSLEKSNVDISSLIHSSDNSTGITVAMSYGEDRAMVTYPGAMSDLTINDITEEDLLKAKHLHVSSIFLQEGLLPDVHLLFEKAKKLGLTTSLDPQWDPTEKWDVNLQSLLPFVDIFLPNEVELRNMTQTSSIEEGIHKIKEYCNHVVVKQGIKGATLFYKDSIENRAAFINKEMVDAIGAGDSFNAGFINAFVQKLNLSRCLEMGVIAGAINTTASGGTGAFSSLDHVRKIAKEKFNYQIDQLVHEE